MASGFMMVSDTLTPGIRRLPESFENRLSTLVDFFGQKTEDYAKVNAPWTDRTGNARQTLKAETEHMVSRHTIILSHGMPYGIWLEIKEWGKYAIVIPTINHMGRQLMAAVSGLLERAAGR